MTIPFYSILPNFKNPVFKKIFLGGGRIGSRYSGAGQGPPGLGSCPPQGPALPRQENLSLFLQLFYVPSFLQAWELLFDRIVGG